MLLRNISVGLTILALVSLCAGPSIGNPDDDCLDFEDCYDTAWDKYEESAELCEDLYEAAKKVCKGLPKGKARKACIALAEAARTCCYTPIVILLKHRIQTCCSLFVDTLGGGYCWSYNAACGG